MKSNRKRCCATVGLIWAACIIVFFFVYMLVLEPQRRARKDVANQLAEQKRVYDSAVEAAQEQTQARLMKQVADLQQRLKDFVVDPGESSNLTFDISETASGQQIDSFSVKSQNGGGPSSDTESGCIGQSRFDVSFAAGFNHFAAFLNALERHQPALFVDSLSITRSDQPNEGHRVKLNIAALVRKQPGN